MQLRVIRTRDEAAGLAAALKFLASRQPFHDMPFGPLVQSIAGSIRRGHYRLALDADDKVVGLVCWALTNADVAARWAAGELTPSFAQCCGGDTVTLTLGAGDHPAVALEGVRAVGRLYPGRAYYMRRHGREKSRRGRFPIVGADVAPAATIQ